MIEKVLRIVELALLAKSPNSVTVHYSGHNRHLSVQVHTNGWNQGDAKTFNCFLSDTDVSDKFDAAIDCVEKMLRGDKK